MKPDIEDRINGIAAVQHGLVTRAQLLRAGGGLGAVKHGVKTKRLRPIQRGVYRVGPMASPREKEMAAVLACGAGASVSHRSAAALWCLLAHPGESAPVDVTLADGRRCRRPGVRAHRGPALEPGDVATVDGIPTTSPARTLLDLARAVGSRELEQAVARAEKARLASRAEVLSLIARHPKRGGYRSLRALVQDSVSLAVTRSEAEERFLALVRKARLPVPAVNVRVGGYEVDFFWRSERLVVEVDGFAFHSSRSQFERDHQKDVDLSARGFQVVRVTWRQIVAAPEATLARLAGTLAVAKLPGWPG